MKNPAANNHNSDDLPQGASVLRSVVKDKETFSVPAQYFETFPDKMEHLLLLKKGEDFKVSENYFNEFPEKIKILTLQQKAENSPTAPVGYFDSLPRILQDKVNIPAKKQQSGIPGIAWGGFALAACLVLGIMLIKPFDDEIKENLPGKQLAQLSKQEINMVAESETFDEATLIEEVSAADLQIPAEESKNVNPAEDNEAIANYLLEQNIDLNTLVNEL
jgi:hypothetical protein